MNLISQTSLPRYLLVSAVLSWVGVVICFLLMQASAGGPLLLCPREMDCRTVLSSKFSAIGGVGLPVVGAMFYFTILTTLLLALALPSAIWRKKIVWMALWLCVVGLSFTVGLMYVQFFVLQAFCGLCTASAVVLFSLTSSLVLGMRSDPQDFRGSPGLAGALFAFALAALAGFYLPMSKPARATVAEVDSRKLLRTQMDQDLRKQVWPLKEKIHSLEAEWVRKNVETTLLELEAGKRRITVGELLAELKIPEVSDAGEPGLKARRDFLEKMTLEHGVRSFLSSLPGPVAFEERDGQMFGPPDAPVELVVFSDFTCKYCIELEAVLRRVRTELPQVKLIHRDFPLNDSGPGFLAAVAGKCAAEQGAYWDYQDKLFGERGKLAEEMLLSLARGMGLDEPRFSQCLRSDAAKEAVRASGDAARRAGVPGTPALYLNGVLIGGMTDFETLRKKILAALESAHRPQ